MTVDICHTIKPETVHFDMGATLLADGKRFSADGFDATGCPMSEQSPKND